MRYTVVLERDEDGIYIATVPALPGCISDGPTVEEALRNVREAVQAYIEDLREDGENIPNDIEIIASVELDA